MNFFTPAEMIKNYGAAGKKKAEMPVFNMLILGFLAGMFIALGAAVTNTAGHSIDNVSAVRVLSGFLFPGGLAVFTMKLASSKCTLPFESAFVLGVFCNILVCFAVLAAMSAKDTAGKVISLFFPICFFLLSVVLSTA